MSSEASRSKNELAALLQDVGIRPSKKLGQNFLIDDGIINSIIQEASKAHPRAIIEIGAGLGTLTTNLAKIADRIIAVELDRRLALILEQTVGHKENVEICRQDFLSFSFARQLLADKALVVGNIPYSITAPILKHLIGQREYIRTVLLLTQQEVAEKISKSPGKDGTPLGILVRSYADVKLLRTVSRTSFFPVPQVDSTLWSFTFLANPRFEANKKTFFDVVRALYSNRRKMIRRALRDILPKESINILLSQASIGPTLRGEDLSFKEIDRLAKAIDDLGSSLGHL